MVAIKTISCVGLESRVGDVEFRFRFRASGVCKVRLILVTIVSFQAVVRVKIRVSSGHYLAPI